MIMTIEERSKRLKELVEERGMLMGQIYDIELTIEKLSMTSPDSKGMYRFEEVTETERLTGRINI